MLGSVAFFKPYNKTDFLFLWIHHSINYNMYIDLSPIIQSFPPSSCLNIPETFLNGICFVLPEQDRFYSKIAAIDNHVKD